MSLTRNNKKCQSDPIHWVHKFKPEKTRNSYRSKLHGLSKFSILAGSALLIGMSASGEALAKQKPAKIKSSSFSANGVYQQSEINVLSTGGKKWDVIQAGNLKVRINGHVDPRRGILEYAGFFLGNCRVRAECDAAHAKVLHADFIHFRDRKNWRFDRVIDVPTSKILVSSSSGISVNPVGDQIVRGCNEKLDSWGPGTAHSFNVAIPISLSMNTDLYYRNEFDGFHNSDTYKGGNWGRSTSFLVKVNCIPRNELMADAKPWKIKTTLEDPAGFNQQDSCPRKIIQRTEIIYPRPASATFHIKANGKKLQTFAATAQKQGLITTPLGEPAYPFKEQYKIVKESEIELPGGPNGVHAKIKGGMVGPTAYYHVHCPDFRVSFSNLRYDFVKNGECPRTVWETATFHTNGPGKVKYKIQHSGGIVFKTGEVESKLFSNGKYKAVAQRTFSPTEAVEWDMKAIPVGFEDAQSTLTKLKYLCNPKSDGNFSNDTSNDDPINPTVAKWQGDIAIADGNAPKGNFPRPAQVVFNVESETSGNFNYHISCSNGRTFQGSANSFQSGSGKWKAFGAHNFNQTRPMALQCRLREVKANGKKKSIDKATFRFEAGRVNPEVAGGVDGLTSGGRKPTNASTGSGKIGTKVAPPKRTNGYAQICLGGKIRYGNVCQCPQGTKRVKIGTAKYKCKMDRIATPTKPDIKTAPVRTSPPKKRKLVCLGGKVRGNKCACGKNKLVRKVAKKRFQCIAVAKPPKKKQALSVRTNPNKDKPVRTNPNKKKKKVALICKGGKIRGNKCGCSKGYLRKKTGKRKFMCYRPAG
ncbi:MAG: hypothetical protein AAGF54_09935 [Pseudomonadota bacterium]